MSRYLLPTSLVSATIFLALLACGSGELAPTAALRDTPTPTASATTPPAAMASPTVPSPTPAATATTPAAFVPGSGWVEVPDRVEPNCRGFYCHVWTWRGGDMLFLLYDFGFSFVIDLAGDTEASAAELVRVADAYGVPLTTLEAVSSDLATYYAGRRVGSAGFVSGWDYSIDYDPIETQIIVLFMP